MMWAFEPFWMLELIKVFGKPVWKPGAERAYVFGPGKGDRKEKNHDT